ncbi:hypothetical protein GGP41_008922 [Bipolaris sorokiniana]|uniref:Uncharacterized protein n=1 Tax=Cochliobolus sativus TaxID=45130 RepID=A0A8H6DTR1_COCSA|nr:hypothetical protein GGP41_008922 [Bipolaris sorokiniana]
MPKVNKRKSVYKEEVVVLQKHAEAFSIYRRLVKQQANSLFKDTYTGLDKVAPKYTRLKDLINERGILPNNIYNIDKIGYCISIIKEQYLYTKNRRIVFIYNANNRKLITLIKYI